jgi:hypothetical protein
VELIPWHFAQILAETNHLPEAHRRREILNYIADVERWMLKQPQAEFAMGHQFVDGIYVRTMTVPAGVTLSGAWHNRECLTLAHTGTISVLTVDGVKVITGPQMFIAPKGVRRLGFTHTEITWSTIHRTDSTDLDEVESELFSFQEENS